MIWLNHQIISFLQVPVLPVSNFQFNQSFMQGGLLPSGLHLNHHFSQLEWAFQLFYLFAIEHHKMLEGCFTEASCISLFSCLGCYCIGNLMKRMKLWFVNQVQKMKFSLKLNCTRKSVVKITRPPTGKIQDKRARLLPMHQLLRSLSYLRLYMFSLIVESSYSSGCDVRVLCF